MTGLIQPPLTDSQSLETEIKYVVPAYRTHLALRILEQMCDLDSQYPFGIVSSIYYDSKNWDYLREKRDSDYLKTKVRLRWYTQDTEAAGANISYAEVKNRIGSKRMKIRIPTEFSGPYLAETALDNPELLKVPAALAAKGAPIRQPIFPVFTIRYYRRRYIERLSGARISIDYEIASPKSNPIMLATSFPCVLGKTVLEVKGTDGDFPVGLRNLIKIGFRRESFSKYYECYGQITGTYF